MTTHAFAPGRERRTGRVAAALTVLLLTAVAGVALGRATAPNPTPAPGAAPPDTDVDVGEETPAGPTRVEAGVPVGYARTRDGAVTAATQYLLVLDSPVLVDESRLDTVLEVLASTEGRRGLRTSLGDGGRLPAERLNLTANDPSMVWRSVPAGWRIDRYDHGAASVAVWATAVLFTGAGTPTAMSWSTAEVQLRWEAGDWKLHGLLTSDGPAPPEPGAAPGAGATAAAQIRGFTPFRYAPALES